MIWDILLAATIETALGLLAEIGLGDSAKNLRERWNRSDEKERRARLQQAYQRAVQAASDEKVTQLLEERSIQENVVKALLDPVQGFDLQTAAAHWGQEFPQHAPALRRFFNTLQNILLEDDLWGPILKRYQTLRYQQSVQEELKDKQLPASEQRLVRSLSATLHGEGAIAQGKGSRAVGARGTLIEGDVGQLVQLTLQILLSPESFPAPSGDGQKHYLQQLANRANLLPWTYLTTNYADPDQGESFQLSDVYVPLDTTEMRHVEREEELRQYLIKQREMERISAQEMIEEQERLLILGDPGSGKSTLVKYLTYVLAQAGLAAESNLWLQKLDPWSHGDMLPVWLQLRELAAYLQEEEIKTGDETIFLTYWQKTLQDCGLESYWQSFNSQFQSQDNHILILLDGLDEVGQDQRQLVVDMVNQLCAIYPQHRYVVTCRPYAYVGQPWRLNAFHQVTLAPFNTDQVELFIDNWYQQLVKRERMEPLQANRKSDLLKRAVRRRDLVELAERPLLLTVMTQLHAYAGQLPEDRTQLYADTVDLLLQRWEGRLGDDEGVLAYLDIPGLKMSDLKAGLYDAAHHAHRAGPTGEGTVDIDEGSLRKWLAYYLGGSWDKAGDFIAYIRERAGLLIRHKREAYTFPHRTFQEFLAACYWLSENNFPSLAAERVQADWDRWREVFLLAVGYAARTQRLAEAIAAVNELLPIDVDKVKTPGQGDWRAAALVGEALQEIGLLGIKRKRTGQVFYQRVQGWLTAALDQEEELEAPQRAEAGKILGQIGDPRVEILDVDAMPLCYIPAGPFMMGSQEGDQDADEDEQPQHKLDLPAYWISRFPITNGQYDQFVQAGGYAKKSYWPEAIEANIWEDGKVLRRTYDFEGESFKVIRERSDCPYDYGEPFNLANYPVVGISWYEALAFTRWLTDYWHDQEFLPNDWRVALPSEAEWEKAARGGLEISKQPIISVIQDGLSLSPNKNLKPNPLSARIYPWGDDFDANKTNMDATGIDATSAPECFSGGASPYGLFDLSGNVWEWTLSLWGDDWEEPGFKYPYVPNDGRENLEAGENFLRVLRGGAFHSSLKIVRCACRYRHNPYYRLRSDGFRVVVSSRNEQSE